MVSDSSIYLFIYGIQLFFLLFYIFLDSNVSIYSTLFSRVLCFKSISLFLNLLNMFSHLIYIHLYWYIYTHVLSIYLSIYISIYLYACLSVYLSIHLSIFLSFYQSIYLPIYLSIYKPDIYGPTSQSNYLSIYLVIMCMPWNTMVRSWINCISTVLHHNLSMYLSI